MPVSERLIYGLRDPNSGAIRYIGKTTRGLIRPRDQQLPCRLARDGTHKGRWLRLLHAAGQMAEVVVLETISDDCSIDDAERKWIAHGRQSGWPLTNLTDGGDGASPGHKMSAETKERLRRAKLGKPGRPHSSEARALISAAGRGRSPSAETRAKMSAWQKGRPKPAHVRAALFAAGHSPQAHAKRCLALQGRKLSQETRAKMSAAKLRYYAALKSES